jgi:hypothetical protein
MRLVRGSRRVMICRGDSTVMREDSSSFIPTHLYVRP